MLTGGLSYCIYCIIDQGWTALIGFQGILCAGLSRGAGGAPAGRERSGQPRFRYNVYGISLRSEIALSLPEYTYPGLAEIEVCAGSAALLSEAIQGVDLQARSDWYHYAHLADRSSYVRWRGLGEFLVYSDGRRMPARAIPMLPWNPSRSICWDKRSASRW